MSDYAWHPSRSDPSEQISLRAVKKVMTHEPKQNLAWLIERYASNPATADQLRRLPFFTVPADTEQKFKQLLDKFDQESDGPGNK